MAADLHIHTTASDGNWVPAELPNVALERGLEIIAITDHDSTEGILSALHHKSDRLEIIPGVEISTEYQKKEVHILGYWIDYQNHKFQETLTLLRESRVKRAKKMVSLLNQLGFKITFEEVSRKAPSGNIGRPHVAQVLLEHGYANSKTQVFNQWIGRGKPGYVSRFKITPVQAIYLVKGAGGIPVLAHPGLIGDDAIIHELAKSPLRGIEVIHSEHSKEQVIHYRQLAADLGLLPAGGSDCHGPGGKDHVFLGKFSIPNDWVYQLQGSLANS